MGKDKLKRFREMQSFPNVLQNVDFKTPQLTGCNNTHVEAKGKWKKNIFSNTNELVVELACGGGEYTVELGKRFPGKNFIGIDIKGARIYKGAKKALENNLHNVRFLRTRIELLSHFFSENEIDEAWITFPDPFPKDKYEKHRLTSPGFFSMYRTIMKKNGMIHLKTDSELFFEYTRTRLLEENIKPNIIQRDIYNGSWNNPVVTDIQTHYEKMHLQNNKTIHYLNFNLS